MLWPDWWLPLPCSLLLCFLPLSLGKKTPWILGPILLFQKGFAMLLWLLLNISWKGTNHTRWLFRFSLWIQEEMLSSSSTLPWPKVSVQRCYDLWNYVHEVVSHCVWEWHVSCSCVCVCVCVWVCVGVCSAIHFNIDCYGSLDIIMTV